MNTKPTHVFHLGDEFSLVGTNQMFWNGFGCPIVDATEMAKYRAWVNSLPDGPDKHGEDEKAFLQEHIDNAGETDDGRFRLGCGLCWYMEEIDDEATE